MEAWESSVYERAMGALKKRPVTIDDNGALGEKVKAAKYLRDLKKNETVDRNDDVRIAERNLLDALGTQWSANGSVNMTNYLDGGQLVHWWYDFGWWLQYNQFDNQRWVYKRKDGKILTTVTRFNQKSNDDTESPTYIKPPTVITSEKNGSVPGSGMLMYDDGRVFQWTFHTDTGNFQEGKITSKDWTVQKGTFDKNTWRLITGTTLYKNWDKYEGTFDTNTGNYKKGKITLVSWSISEGTFDTNTWRIFEGTVSTKNWDTYKWRFDTNTQQLIEWTITWSDWAVQKWTWKEDGSGFTGEKTEKNWTKIQFRDWVTYIPPGRIPAPASAQVDSPGREQKEEAEKTAILDRLRWTTVIFNEKRSWIDPKKVSISRSWDHYAFTSKEFWFEWIKTPIEVKPNGDLITTEIDFQKPIWVLGFGPKSGKYSLSQDWNTLKIMKKA